MRNFILKLHLYVALVGSLFVVILGLTGSVMAFETEIDQLLHPGLYKIPPRQTAPLSVTRVIEFAKKKFPGSEAGVVGVTDGADESYMVGLDTGAVFVNKYTGEILGIRNDRSFLDYIHQFHLRLLSGKTGETIVGIAGIAMLLLVISGIFLWWRYKQFSIKFGGTLVRAMFDIHTATGIYSALFLLCLSATGIVISNENSIFSWMYRMTDTKPIARFKPPTPTTDSSQITPDRAIEVARTTIPGALPLMVIMPQGPKGSYNVRMHFPEDRTPGGRSWVVVDQYSGEVLAAQNSRTAPGPTRADILNRAIHTGDIFGVFSKIVMSLSSLLIAVQATTGIVLWWKRDKKKK